MRAQEFESQTATGQDILRYVKSIHDDFHLDHEILKHKTWRLQPTPLTALHIPDPESGIDPQDPYDRVQYIDMYHVDDISARDIERRPIVVDHDGHILDGNHRAVAARLQGMKTIPAWRPVEQINEYRDRMFQYLRKQVPNWPKYIVKDWLYANFARGDVQNPRYSFANIGQDLPKILADTGVSKDTQWRLVPDMKFTMDMWEPMTLKRLQARAGGVTTSTDPDVHIPAKDAERHATQAALAQSQGGIRKEPVILIKKSNGYELIEGWHRTIQHFARYPNGYNGPAWVAIAQNVTEQRAPMKFLRPGELRGSYTDQDMTRMGFRRAVNGAWYIDQRRWEQLIRSGVLREGDVIRTKFATRQAQRARDQYQHQPDVEIPLYDRKRNRAVKPEYAQGGEEAFDHFVAEPSSRSSGSSMIIGVTRDQRKVIVSNWLAPVEVTQKFADAMNRGGFSDVPIQRVPIQGYDDQ